MVLDPVMSSLRPGIKASENKLKGCAQAFVQDQDPTNQLLSYLPLDCNADEVALGNMNVELKIDCSEYPINVYPITSWA